MIVYRILTDFLHIHLFLGPKPSDVMKQLTSEVGRLQKPPSKLALGYVVCRKCSMENDCSSRLDHDLKQMSDANIPYDGDCISHDLLSTGATKFQTQTILYYILSKTEVQFPTLFPI